jgi:hypothetical protein
MEMRVDMSGRNAAMKRRLCGLVPIGLLTACVLSAQQLAPRPERSVLSQTGPASISIARDGTLSKQFQKRFVHATKRYRLTAEQRAQVKSILWKEQTDTHTLSADNFMSARDKRDEMAHLYETSQQKIGSILTEQQKRKFDSDEKTRAWMEGRLPEPNPGPPLNF